MPKIFGGFDPATPGGRIGNTALTRLEDAASAGIRNVLQGGLNKVSSNIGKALGITLPLGQSEWLSRAMSRADPHLNVEWTIEMPDGLGAEYVEEATATMSEFDIEGVFRGGSKSFYPSIINVSTISLSFYEDQLFTSTQYLRAWRDRIGDTGTGLLNYPEEFKRHIKIKALDLAGNAIAIFDYGGCWPVKMPTYNFGSSDAQRTILQNVEFSVDYMNLTFPGFSGRDLFGFGKIQDFMRGLPASISQGLTGRLSGGINNALGQIKF